MLFTSTCASLLLLVSGAAAAPSTKIANCKGVFFTVTGNALNLEPGSIVLTNGTYNLTAVVNNATTATESVGGTQTLAGWYCDPVHQNANSTKLQVFRGSFFTNRESWTALGGTNLMNPPTPQYEPSMYSWFDYANKLGYPTLAIDSLGAGLSSRPDGLLFAQLYYE